MNSPPRTATSPRASGVTSPRGGVLVLPPVPGKPSIHEAHTTSFPTAPQSRTSVNAPSRPQAHYEQHQPHLPISPARPLSPPPPSHSHLPPPHHSAPPRPTSPPPPLSSIPNPRDLQHTQPSSHAHLISSESETRLNLRIRDFKAENIHMNLVGVILSTVKSSVEYVIADRATLHMTHLSGAYSLHLEVPGLLKIDLTSHTPVFRSVDYQFLLLEPHGPNKLYLITFLDSISEAQMNEFEELVDFFSFYQTIDREDREYIDKQLSKHGRSIEDAGMTIGQGIVKGAQFLGRGMRRGVSFYKKHSTPGKPRYVTQSEKRRVYIEKKISGGVVGATGTVVRGLNKGLGFVGKGLAFGVDKVRQVVDDPNEKKEVDVDSNTNKAKGYAKSTIHAAVHVVSGVKNATVVLGSEVRENAVAVTEHREGAEAATLTREKFNMVGDAGKAGLHVWSLVGLMDPVRLGTRVAIGVGRGIAAYDGNRKHILSGAQWASGWIALQGDYFKGEQTWRPYYAVLRAYSISFYENEDSDHENPEQFLRVMDLNMVGAEPAAALARRWTVRLVTHKHVFFFSLDVREHYQKQTKSATNISIPSDEQLSSQYNHWIDSLAALASLQNPFYVDKDSARKRSMSQ